MATPEDPLTRQAIASGDLTDLVSPHATATPTADSILTVLNARFRSELPYARIGSTDLVVVNPCKTLSNVNDASAREYEERCYKDTSLSLVDARRPPQPHVFELAAQMYLLMRRRGESQAVIARYASHDPTCYPICDTYKSSSGVSGSGKTFSIKLLVDQILRLSAHSKRERKIAEQIKAFSLVLESFGNAKSPTNPNASRHIRYIELHFNDRGRISAAKVLAFGLDKSRLTRLSFDERCYHVFYQLLAGATPAEEILFLEGPSEYSLLASSGCYRLPAGPFSDDGIAMDELREAFKTLGFKSKHVSSIFSVISAILLLGNIQFGEADASDVSAYVVNQPVLQQVAQLLGVSEDELAEDLTCKTNYVRKELVTVLLDAKQCATQRDQLVQSLYAILFSFIVETANYKLAPLAQTPSCSSSQIVLLDQAGFQTKTQSSPGTVSPFISAFTNGFEEFCINFANEVVEAHVLRSLFDDSAGFNARVAEDGISLSPAIALGDTPCAKLLCGPHNERDSRKPGGLLGVIDKAVSSYKSGRSDSDRGDRLLQDLDAEYHAHPMFSVSPDDRKSFTIIHHIRQCSYDISGFVEKDADLVDPQFVKLLCSSSDSLVAKLMTGPGLATEKHQSDPDGIVQAQVLCRPVRDVTPLMGAPDSSPRPNPNKIYSVTTQLHQTLWSVLSNIEHVRLWTMLCISPNDNGFSNCMDKQRVKTQIRGLHLPEVISRKDVEFVVELDHAEFCERYRPTMRGSHAERIRQCAHTNGWDKGDFAIGHQKIWLRYHAWKMVEDVIRSAEKEQKKSTRGGSAEDESVRDDMTEYPPDDKDHGLFDEPSGSAPSIPRTPSAYGGFTASRAVSTSYGYGDESGSMWDKKTEGYESAPPLLPKTGVEPVDGGAEAFEERLPTTRVRRYWLYLTWLFTWWIPSFLLTHVGRMKRPDVRLAWREKFTIFILIFFANLVVLFYIIAFGVILCPNFNKAWSTGEVAQHTSSNDFYVSIQGRVYDVSNFVRGDHSDVTGQPSNSQSVLSGLAGTDMTYYFPPPLSLACTGLVSDPRVQITVKNTTLMLYPSASHASGVNSHYNPSALDSATWYLSNFRPTMNQFYKGTLVWEPSDIFSQANDTNIER